MRLELRPMTVLNEWLSKYGFDKNRTTGDNRKTMCYTRTSEYTNDDWCSRWALAGMGDDPTVALAEAFESSMNNIKHNMNGEFTPELEAILLVTHGVGRWAFAHPETGEACSLEDLPEELQEVARNRESEGVGCLLYTSDAADE